MPRVAAAHEPVRSSIFAPQPHSLFSWARSSVEPAVKQQQRVRGVEIRHSKHAGLKKPTLQHHKASAKAQRNHRFVETRLSVQEAPEKSMAPEADTASKPKATGATAATGAAAAAATAAATGVHEFVETLAGSFIISGLENKLDLQRYDNMVRRALMAVTNFTKEFR